ncbi:hypothetical protein OG455_01465 [Kitasatospora sp. NBC_01287]|uniref:hypothetical protein n=1 Tax=Kitasatospora sp. NBC_01287 TaxID=2903573 RepID=UPI00225B0400|nr:hypothetical protein [Kitasatospora sp. NBC_01287]MCX4744194.1 hypothetical protein [Kitasatospora sp. NBC_01287]
MSSSQTDPVEPESGGRELTPGVTMLATTVAVVSLLVGTLMAGVSLSGHVFGAWQSPGPVSQGLVGAAMLGVCPGLFSIGRAGLWEEVRTLVLPLAIVLVGLLAVTLLNGGRLQVVRGGPIILVFFSLGWVAVLGVLGLCAVGCLLWQYLRPARPLPTRVAPLPAWSRPALAVLGSGWFGIGAGLLVDPGFWSALVPWQLDRPDAQALGVWGLALGVGVLGALAEDDLTRTRPALLALPGVAVAVAVVLTVRGSQVRWASAAGVSLITLVGGLLVAGLTGQWLLSRRAAAVVMAAAVTTAAGATDPAR